MHAALIGLDATAALAGAPASPPANDEAPSPSGTFDARAAAPPAGSSIAVLPFLDMSAERDQGYLCDGHRRGARSARSPTCGASGSRRERSSFRFKFVAADAREVGGRLGVDAVLEGAVRRAGSRLRVTVQLVDVATGYQRWAHRFDGTLDDVFAIEDEISGRVGIALRGLLSTRERDAIRRPGTSADAYGFFLRGRQLIHTVSPSAYEEAVQMFERAIDIDPTYAPAYAGLAEMHCRYFEWADGGERAREAADRASRRALELAPRLPEAHIARGQVLKAFRDHAGAEREFKDALSLHPESFDAYHLYGRMMFQWGKIVESVPLFRRASELRLEDFQSALLLAQSLRRLGRAEEAIAARGEGLRRVERHLELQPGDPRALSMGAAELAYVEGERERTLDWARRAGAAAPDDAGVWYNVACTYAGLGMKDEALAWLRRIVSLGMGSHEWIRHDPDFDSLRGDARFEVLFS